MERLKAARFVNNFSRALPEPEPKAAPPPVVEAQLPTNANIGNLGTSNAVLGDSDGPYLHITMTSLGNSALLDALSVVRSAPSACYVQALCLSCVRCSTKVSQN